jgi:hypothetical protein
MEEKLSFRLLEGRIRPFVESLVPDNLERLNGHAQNLKKVLVLTIAMFKPLFFFF